MESRPSQIAFLLPIIVTFLAAGGCGRSIDVGKVLQVIDVTSGWFDAGIHEGKNQLLPSISFRLKNTGDQKIGAVQVNAVFRRVNENEVWSDTYVKPIGSEGLEARASSPPIVLRATVGYTGTDPRAAMLRNSQFVDAKVKIFARSGSANWAALGEYPVQRILLTH
jgi:hypothetical protein